MAPIHIAHRGRLRTMHYQEFPPSVALAPYIRCLWLFEADHGTAGGEVQRIVPDGFPELILHYGAQYSEISEDGRDFLQPRALMAGQISRPLILKPGTRSGVIGVRFWPTGARAVLGLRMIELTNQRLDVSTLWGRHADLLLDEVDGMPTPSARIAAVERFLSARLLHRQQYKPDLAIAHCVASLRATGGSVSVDALARQAGLSSRQIERRFLDHVGVPPRLFASILRFRRVFDSIEQEPERPAKWTEAALSAGYFDQAHMIRDFRRFAGLQPTAFYQSLEGLSAAMLTTGG